jgi:hypothetical protein
MTKIRYDFDAINKAIERDNAVLLNTYTKVTKRTNIYYRCNCGQEHHKTCLQIVNRNGAFCKQCTKIRGTKKLHETLSKKLVLACTPETLNSVIIRDKAILIEEYDVICKNTIIKFKCNCGEDSEKNCLQLITVSGAFCTKCTRVTWTQKQQNTNMEKWGVLCTVHAPEIKEQIIINNINKYGYANVFQSPEIREMIRQTFLDKYGVEVPSQSEEVKEKMKNTILERYGVENVMYLEDIKERIIQTCIERYGVEHVLQNEEIKEKARQTCIERYGVEYASQSEEFRERVRQTFINNYGVDNPNKTKEVRDKITQTCIERYGVEHPTQSEEIQQKIQKNAKRYKQYTLPSGTTIKVQGYEPFALDNLLKEFTEDDIITNRRDIPRITYFDTIKNKNRYYFPDIYIKSINKIIEVKSTWTFKCKNDNIELKEKATRDAGYDYEIFVYNRKGERIQ